MTSPTTVVRQCTEQIVENGRTRRCANSVRVPVNTVDIKCHVHGNYGGSPYDRRFNEVNTGGKYQWAIQQYPAPRGTAIYGGTCTGIQLARRNLALGIRRMVGERILPAMAGALALDAQETWTDFPEYRISIRVWRIS